MAESGEMVTRRTFAIAGLSALSGCGGRNRATGFSGYAFIANQEGGAIAAVDLEVFAVARHIRVRSTRSAPTISLSRASCRWLPLRSKCGFLRPAMLYMSCVEDQDN